MGFSEARTQKLAKRIARDMIARRAVRLTGGEFALADVIGRTLSDDQEAESAIEVEAREQLAKRKNIGPPGSGDYNAAFSQAKASIARRKGFKL
jgi:hypothetical protein